jgi:hypothetical protein
MTAEQRQRRKTIEERIKNSQPGSAQWHQLNASLAALDREISAAEAAKQRQKRGNR